MNTSLPVGHRDPRTEFVSGTYLHLAADLLTFAPQDLNYWNTVRIPHRPTDRVAFEELRQLAVFLPLVLVAIAFYFFSFTGALIALVVAVPVMKALHNALRNAIVAKGAEWHRRDAGRYAFTEFICNEFDLRPEDVSMKLVLKMCRDFNVWMDVATRLRHAAEAAERARRPVPAARPFRRDAPATKFAHSAPVAAGAAVAAVNVDTPVVAADLAMQFNPVSGLPMLDGMVDVHGNMYGTDTVDVMFDDANQHGQANTHCYEPQFAESTPIFGSFGND